MVEVTQGNLPSRPSGLGRESGGKTQADKNWGGVHVIITVAPPHYSVGRVSREASPGAIAPLGHPLAMGLFSKHCYKNEIPGFAKA